MNEVKIDAEKAFNIAKNIPDGYKIFFNLSEKKGYAGTAILTKVNTHKMDAHIGVHKHDLEGRATTVEFDEFILIAVYVPNAGDDLRRLKYRTEEWDKDFFDYIDKLRHQSKKPVIVAGDLNVAHNEIDIFDTKGKEK